MYLTVKYENGKPNRWIPLNDHSSINDVEVLVNTLRSCPGVDEVYVNVKDTNNAKKTDNTSPTP